MAENDNMIEYYVDWGNPGFDVKQCLISAESGYAFAQDMMGNCYKYGVYVKKDFAAAVAWFEKAALQGNAAAQRSLGYCYDNGHGVEQNYEKAVYWYIKGAEGGDIDAQQNLAICYEHGFGVEKIKNLGGLFYVF